ncbi:pentapeptide repeat protein [Parafrankia sp. EUN1f]|nr:pentapeptide repeat protein [Parafrankia sp. EUN1f]
MLWIVAGVAAIGAGVAVLGIWNLPDRMYPPGTDGGAEARAALQGGLLTAAAALTAVAGALIALDETRQANAETRRANVAADARERAANLNTHVRELYVEAAKLLNDPDNLGVRLAGIYALERIAVDSPADQRTVVEVLSAFVRTRSTDLVLYPPPPADGQDAPSPVRPAADIRAAVQVLGRLPLRDDVPRCDLTGATLTGPASLVDLTLTDANLAGAHLVGADLAGAHLVGVNLTKAQLDAANLSNARLDKANLTEAQMDGVNLTGARLGEAILTRARLHEATLIDAKLLAASLSNTWLDRSDLTRANLGAANLTGAQLGEADLTRAHLGAANLTGAWLFGTNLTLTWLNGTNLAGAQGMTVGQVASAVRADAGTRLPDYLERPGSWPPYDPLVGGS